MSILTKKNTKRALATPADMVRLSNRTQRLIHLSNVETAPEQIDPITKKTIKAATVLEGPRLIPGGNNVRRDYVEALMAQDSRGSELFALMVETGEIVEDARPGAIALPEGPEPPKTLAGRKQPAALGLVKDMNRPDVLALWHKTEKRKPVRAAIEAKLASIGQSNTPEAMKAAAAKLEEAPDDEIEVEEDDAEGEADSE